MTRARTLTLWLTPLLLTATLSAHAGSVQLPETGQTGCWDASDSAIACTSTSTGQDGDKLMGAAWPASRFTDNGNGSLTDNLTGLIWLKDAGCLGAKTWQEALTSVNALAVGNSQCTLSDGSAAGDWRLPNRNELISLANYQQASGSVWLTSQGFTNARDASYWTSDSYLPSPADKWRVHTLGIPTAASSSDSSTYVMAVRGGHLGDATVAVSPASVDFGTVAASASAASTVTVSNTGSAARMQVNALTLVGSDAAKFALNKGDGTAGTCGPTPILAPNASCTVSVVFNPDSSASKSVSLRISSSDTATPNKSVALVGNPSSKPGDCDSSSSVSVAEVQSGINMFLGLKAVTTCVDVDGSQSVSISEVQKVVNAFLGLP